MIAVVDSSAFVSAFTTESGKVDAGLIKRLSEIRVVQVPDIADAEFLHAIRGLWLGGKITEARARQARDLFASVPKERQPTHRLAERIWTLRHNLGAYDACFVALAELLEVPLITCDDKQATASGHYAEVEVFGPVRPG